MISWIILLSLGILLMIFEIGTLNFFFFFFGCGFIFVSIISYFFFIDWYWQLFLASFLALIMIFIFKKKLISMLSKRSEKYKDNFLDEKGIGVIKEGMVYFKGTFWKCDNLTDFKNGDKVEILGVVDNKLKIKGLID